MLNYMELAESLLAKSGDDLGKAERMVLQQADDRRTVSTDTNAAFAAEATFGERVADRIAAFGGSWTFIIGFIAFLVIWVVLNAVLLTSSLAFDPYPFIFLNLVMSMIAALQAPVIMMSQNRQSARDRFAAAKDYEVNLKAEIEVLALHHKIDMFVLKELAELRRDVSELCRKLDEAKA
jgi:uncharacterized membrane protein